MEFICWLDYANSLAKECCIPEIVQRLAENIRMDLFEMSIEPMISVLDMNIAGFMLVLVAKIIKQIDAKEFCDGKMIKLVRIFTLCINHGFNFSFSEIATWLVGSSIVVDGDDLATNSRCDDGTPAVLHTDCLLNIIVENAQDNLDILLPTLQFVEVGIFKEKIKLFFNGKLTIFFKGFIG